jgi:hypothetical protein
MRPVMWSDVLLGLGGEGSNLQACIRLQADLVTGMAVFQ